MGPQLTRILIGAVGLVLVVVVVITALRSESGVVQPIAYNHQVHVEGVGLACVDCHTRVETSARATLPTIEICQNCHAGEPVSESPEEARLIETYLSPNVPIEWQRVYRVPDHVYFSHRRHVVGGEIECVECHGNIAEMTSPISVPAVRPTMETCTGCHRERKVTNDCLSCHR